MSIVIDYVTVGPFQENTFFVWNKNSHSVLLIDPGDDPDTILLKIKSLSLNPVGIINTHAHLDHVGAVAVIKDEFSVPFYLHQAEKQILEHYPDMCSMFGIKARKVPKVDHWINGDCDIQIEEFTITCIETPGHTPGGTTFLIEENCFCGDTLFAGSIGRTDLPGGNYTTLMESLKKMKNRLNHDWNIFPGHGPKTTMKNELYNNPFLVSIKD